MNLSWPDGREQFLKGVSAGKWIPELRATTPVPEAARTALSLRLTVVRDCLPRALDATDADPEHVHQLRVGTRRARAALDLFKDCLPRKVYKAARKELRRLRQVAGAARDWDVFLAGLEHGSKQRGAKHRPALDFLVGHAVGRRMEAQAKLQELGSDYPDEFDRLSTETVDAVRERHDAEFKTLIDLAQPTLRGLIEELETAAGGDLTAYANLHQVRIIGKRLRYAMELFGGCFGPAFRRKLYPAVQAMQDILGRANDCVVAGNRFEEINIWLRTRLPVEAKRFTQGLVFMRRDLQRRLAEEERLFAEWWAAWPRLPWNLGTRSPER